MRLPFSDIDSDSFQAFENYLKQNPDVFLKNRRLLKYITTPSRTLDDKVIDFQKQQLNYYKAQNQLLEDQITKIADLKKREKHHLLRVHQSVIALLRTPSMEALYNFTHRILPGLLGIDLADIYLACNPQKIWSNIPIISSVMVNDLFGNDRMILRSDTENAIRILDEGCISDALLKIQIDYPSIIGVVVLGSYQEGYFESGQSTETLSFLQEIFSFLIEYFAQFDTIKSSER